MHFLLSSPSLLQVSFSCKPNSLPMAGELSPFHCRAGHAAGTGKDSLSGFSESGAQVDTARLGEFFLHDLLKDKEQRTKSAHREPGPLLSSTPLQSCPAPAPRHAGLRPWAARTDMHAPTCRPDASGWPGCCPYAPADHEHGGVLLPAAAWTLRGDFRHRSPITQHGGGVHPNSAHGEIKAKATFPLKIPSKAQPAPFLPLSWRLHPWQAPNTQVFKCRHLREL